MNEIEKQIEEMERDLKNCLPSDWFWLKTVDFDAHLVAKHFYNLGYRNCKDKVVLSKEELNTLIGNIEKSSEIKAEELEKVRKETAREILTLVKQKSWCYQEDEDEKPWTYSITVTQLKEIAKQYGVEVE